MKHCLNGRVTKMDSTVPIVTLIPLPQKAPSCKAVPAPYPGGRQIERLMGSSMECTHSTRPWKPNRHPVRVPPTSILHARDQRQSDFITGRMDIPALAHNEFASPGSIPGPVTSFISESPHGRKRVPRGYDGDSGAFAGLGYLE